MFKAVIRSTKRIVNNIKNRIKQWNRPITIKLALNSRFQKKPTPNFHTN